MKYFTGLVLFVSFVLCFFSSPLTTHALFSDTSGYQYEKAILALADSEMIHGYEDGSFGPKNPVKRSEFLKILLQNKLSELPDATDSKCFSDIKMGEWWTPYVCFAKDQGFISGYTDKTFRPQNILTAKEVAKILVEVLIGKQTPENPDRWFETYFQILDERKAIPPTIRGIDQVVTRGEMVEMMWRIQNDIRDQESTSLEILYAPKAIGKSNLPSVDMQRVFDEWVSLHNNARGTSPKYIYDTRLSDTAYEWASYSADRGAIDHKRPGQSAYYDYPRMVKWFGDRGINFQQGPNPPFSESIAWYPYSCTSGDCTQKVIDILHYTFNWYMAEAGKSWAPHYHSIVNPKFQVIGLGLEVGHGKLFFTTHYGTGIE